VFEERAIDDRLALIDQQIQRDLPIKSTWRSRSVSAALVAFYLVVAVPSAGRFSSLLELTFRLITGRYLSSAGPGAIVGFCVLPVACIWFPGALGDSVGGRITRKSPRSFVWFLGWVVLLLPLIAAAILYFRGADASLLFTMP
jgi:hypothetical protein